MSPDRNEEMNAVQNVEGNQKWVQAMQNMILKTYARQAYERAEKETLYTH